MTDKLMYEVNYVDGLVAEIKCLQVDLAGQFQRVDQLLAEIERLRALIKQLEYARDLARRDRR